jgi:cobalt ECF transporter T component CbiQ
VAQRRGLLQSLDPRVKLVGLLLLIVAAAVARRIEAILATFGIALLLALASRVPLRTMALRAWGAVFVFTGLIVLPALFLTPGHAVWALPVLGWSVTEQGLRGSAYLLSRVETTATLALLLVATTRWAHVLKALRVLRIPAALVAILGMTYRYIFVTITTAREMFESRRCRLVGPLRGPDRRRLAAATAGVLLDKTMQLSGEVYLAMLSRGFTGEVFVLEESEMSAKDWFGLTLFIATGAGLIWLGI